MIRPFAAFGLALAVTAFAALAAESGAPFTPAEDLEGTWTFTADPRLPNVLILGDSISLGYTRAARAQLKGKANVYRAMRGNAPANCGDTRIGLQNIDAWLGSTKWDVIHFNWGLWDLCYRNPQSKTQGNRDKVGGTLSVPIDEYERNLDQLVGRMEKTGAKLIWATTTTVPEKEAGRFVGDEDRYNAAAARVMQRHNVRTDDLCALTKRLAGKYSKAEGDVHFTPEGYTRLASQVSAVITEVLANRK
jgi:lysophospholipase L1-like esterase